MHTTFTDAVTRRLAMAFQRSEPAPAPTRWMWIADTAIAVVLTVYGVIAILGNRPPGIIAPLGRPLVVPHELRAVLFAVVTTLPLAARRRYPLAVFLVVLLGTVVLRDNPAGSKAALLTCLIGAYSAARYSPHRLLALVSPLLAATLIARYFSTGLPDIPSVLTSFAILVPLALAADAIRTGRRRAEENRERIRALERAQEETMRHAVEQERSRIARELHDVVTHNVSVMVVQAGAARKIMATDPDQARDALLAVEASGRSAMSELRQVMGLLTSNGAEPADDLAPQPGVDQLPALVDRVRTTGTPIELAVTGPVVPLPQGVDLAAYRVVQEALTNAVKHAVGAAVRVGVHYGPDTVDITVTDSGGPASSAAGNGRGLIGLRERLAVYGGSLDAGGRPGGGYRVRAVIPLEQR